MLMCINTHKRLSQDNEIIRFLITNMKGENIYAHWKVIYEEISEELLHKN